MRFSEKNKRDCDKVSCPDFSYSQSFFFASINTGITTMGLGNFSYWSSWVISSLILTITTSSIQIICGKAFGFDIFTKTPFFILLFFFVSYGMSINGIGNLITNVCTDTANG